MKLIVLAGGGGSRLFPLSRTKFPKQFLKIASDITLLAETVTRYLDIVKPEDVIVLTNEEYRHHVKADLEEAGVKGVNVLFEPTARGTAPAVAMAVRYCKDKLGSTEDEIIFIAPSDHVIMPKDLFIKDAKTAIEVAKENKLVTLGIRPTKPETGYGYIKIGAKNNVGYEVEQFVEKPDIERASHYVRSGGYYWNSGMYAISIRTLIGEFSLYQSKIYDLLTENNYENIVEKFMEMPEISFDYAIAEKSTKVVMIPLTPYWNDIGSWDAIYEAMEKDVDGNVKAGDCLTYKCNNSLFISDEKLVTGVGLEDTIVISTDDVILVSKKGESQKVKQVVDGLKQNERKEATKHTVDFRQWGNYKVVAEGERYQVNQIFVHPGQSVNLYTDEQESQHWIVLKGVAGIKSNGREAIVSENESIFIPRLEDHIIKNLGNTELEIIEVQNRN